FDSSADGGEGLFDKLAHRMGFASGEHVVVGLGLLHDHPHALGVIAGMAPVAPGVEVADIEGLLLPGADRGHGAGYLARNERFAADRALVVEQDAVRGMYAVSFAVIHRNPISIELRGAVWAARRKGRRFPLRNLRGVAVKLRGRRLIEAGA